MMKIEKRDLGRSQLAKLAGVNLETVRFYERNGLMPEPIRNAVGYRQYGATDLKRLRFIRRSKELGFSITETRQLLSMSDGQNTCGDIQIFAEDHIRSIKSKISDLKKMQKTLSVLAESCADNRSAECPMIDTLMAD